MDFWDFLTKTYYGGLILISVGGLIITYVLKFPQKEEESYPYDIKYWAAGITFLLLGIVLIFAKLLGKL